MEKNYKNVHYSSQGRRLVSRVTAVHLYYFFILTLFLYKIKITRSQTVHVDSPHAQMILGR